MQYSPGQRLLLRDAEWLLKRVEATPEGETALVVSGISEIVRGREAIFLPRAEGGPESIKVLDPAKTVLVQDSGQGFLRTRLHLESQLRRMPPVGGDLWLGHKAAMDVLPFQLDPAVQALAKPRQRILIADTVGLGKTLEAGILTAELARRGRARRILVVTMKSILAQFQREWWSRFTLPLVRLDSQGIQRVRNHLPTHANPFHYYDRSIISLDTLKQPKFREHLSHAWWDVIVLDEAHNVAATDGTKLSNELAELLSSRSDTLIMLSATPHNGRKRSFASLMNMLDPTAIANPDDYGPEDIQGLYVRRFRKDVIHDLKANVPDRKMLKVTARASEPEEAVFRMLQNLSLSTDRAASTNEGRVASGLFRTTLLKSFLSSPVACAKTLEHRIEKSEKGAIAATPEDIAKLRDLRRAVEAVGEREFSKYQELKRVLKGWKPSATDRLVLFTERIESLRWLQSHLLTELGFKEGEVAVLHGQLPDTEIMDIVDQFGQEKSRLRLLLASDVAAEGINLHYLCHRMVHFDMPWSLMVFAQRNGRIDRYGQKHQPEISYFLTASAESRSDERVMELLLKKDEEARDSIGDPSVLLGTYTEEEQEQQTARAIEHDAPLEAPFAQPFDPFELFLAPPSAAAKPTAQRQELPSLFSSDYHYTANALRWLKEREGDALQYDLDDTRRELFLTIHKDSDTDDLASRFSFLPSEIVPDKGRLHLTSSKTAVMESIEAARATQGEWPKAQYLWPLHPVMEWLDDRVQGAFGRHEAPVIPVPKLASNEVVVVLSGTVPNRLGQPMVHRWMGVLFRNGAWAENLPLETVVERCSLNDDRLIDKGIRLEDRMETFASLLPRALAQVATPYQELRKEHLARHKAELEIQTGRLAGLLAQHEQQIELEFSKGLESVVTGRKERRRHEVKKAFEAHEQWLRDAYHLEEHIHFTVLAVCAGA